MSFFSSYKMPERLCTEQQGPCAKVSAFLRTLSKYLMVVGNTCGPLGSPRRATLQLNLTGGRKKAEPIFLYVILNIILHAGMQYVSAYLHWKCINSNVHLCSCAWTAMNNMIIAQQYRRIIPRIICRKLFYIMCWHLQVNKFTSSRKRDLMGLKQCGD